LIEPCGKAWKDPAAKLEMIKGSAAKLEIMRDSAARLDKGPCRAEIQARRQARGKAGIGPRLSRGFILDFAPLSAAPLALAACCCKLPCGRNLLAHACMQIKVTGARASLG
jgi:hypothetical protein